MLPQLIKEATLVANPAEFFSALGWLHDADLESFEWKIANGSLAIEVDDLYSNFYQTPEYPGKLSARFIASDVQNLQVDVIASKINSIRILKFHVAQKTGEEHIYVAISFGEGHIKFECQKLVGMIR